MTDKVVQLNRTDRARMKKISKGIEVLLKESVRIGTRAVKADNPKFAKVVQKAGAKATKVQIMPPRRGAKIRAKEEMHGISMQCFGSGPGMCLVYNDDLGTCSVV